MANHGRIGDALATYLRRRSKSHEIAGVFTTDAGNGTGKLYYMTQAVRRRKLILRGTGKGKSGIVHYRPYRCAGRHGRQA
jgi:hypothetical protein